MLRSSWSISHPCWRLPTWSQNVDKQYVTFGCIRVINIVFVSTWWNYSHTQHLLHTRHDTGHMLLKRRETCNTTTSQTFWCLRREMMRSMPLKAPDATNKMFVVSTATESPRSLRELRSGTLTIVPSSSFSIPCINNAVPRIISGHP